MKNSHPYHSELISKYLAGEITKEEIRVLKAWLQSDPEHQKLFEDYRNTWLAVESSKIDSTIVVDDEWKKLQSRILESQKSEARSQKPGTLWHKLVFSSLPPDNSTRINSGFQWAARIAAVFFFIAISTFFLFKYLNDQGEKLIAAKEEIIETILPDGTLVSLNNGSTLAYPEHFNGNTRKVKLNGEAYFTVKHDTSSKFVIVSGNVRIEDIGTSFYVNTNKADYLMEVVLDEGKASVYFGSDPSGKVIISPGEKAEIRLNGNTIRKTVNHDENYLSWKTRRLVFSNNTLNEVISLLNKVYHSDIRLSEDNLNNCRLTAIFDNQSLESVLNVIKSTLDVSIISHGTTFEISGSKCDL